MTSETAWWCEHAWLPPGTVAHGVLVRVSAGVITAVLPDANPPPHVHRLAGLVLPGLASTHSHAFHRALRGRTQRRQGNFWTWRKQMYALADRLDPDSYLALATAAYAEMVLAGISCVGEFHYLHHGPGGVHYGDPNAMGHALAEAARRAGVRLTLLDTCYLQGGFDKPLAGAQLRFGDGDAAGWAARWSDFVEPGVRTGAAVHSVRAVPADEIAVVAKFAADAHMPLHAHLSEQPAENDGCLARYGRTPTQLLEQAGAMSAATVAVHATHVSVADRSLLAGSRTGVCLCPSTDYDLADGIGPAAALAGDGVSLSLGSDSHAVVDLFAEARAVELGERAKTLRRGHFSADQLLTMATVNGHRALGWPDAGEIAAGRRADLVAVDLGSPRTAGCGTSADTVVFAAAACDVTDVVVDGEQVVRDRCHLRVRDVGAALRSAVEAVRA
jgi:formiminoglutamate deiminase